MLRPLLILTIAALGATACSSDSTDSAGLSSAATNTAASFPPLTVLTSVVPNPSPDETLTQQGARELAAQYLAYAAFSVDGLIQRLQLEGYSEDDAAYAVFVSNVDWNDQAVKRGRVYIEREAITRTDLIGRLLEEGFTLEQAEASASANGL